MELDSQAVSLNDAIKAANPAVLDMLSAKSKAIFFPKLGILAHHAHFHGMRSRHRHQGLFLQAAQARVRPSQGRDICDIGKSHDVAPPPGSAYPAMGPVAVSEGVALLVAGRAAHGAVDRQVGVIEQSAA